VDCVRGQNLNKASLASKLKGALEVKAKFKIEFFSFALITNSLVYIKNMFSIILQGFPKWGTCTLSGLIGASRGELDLRHYSCLVHIFERK